MARTQPVKRSRRRSSKRRRAQQRRRLLKVALPLVVLLVVIGVIVAVYQSVSNASQSRMAPFAQAPASAHVDLLYLSYLDSLAREFRALPPEAGDRQLPIAQLVAQRAGVPVAKMRDWGLYPKAESGYGELSMLFRELHRRGRLVLPLEDEPLWIHLRERQLHPGYLVFGRTAAATDQDIDFCAVLTAVNIIQPGYSVLLYRDPLTGQLIHGNMEDLPQITYLGGARLGDSLSSVYQTWFRLRDQRDKKPLFR